MKPRYSAVTRPILRLGGLLPLLIACPLWGAAGTWTSTGSGNWSDTARWSGGIVADGAGFTADFNTINPTSDVVVTLDSARTIGNLTFGDTNTGTAAGWVISGSNTLTLSATTPTVTVNALGSGKSAEISAALAGSGGFTKQGTGRLLLSGNNSGLSGTVTIKASGGTVAINSAAALGSAGVNMPDTASLACSFELLGGSGGITSSNSIRIAGGGLSNTGALRNLSGDNVLSNFGFSHSSAGGRIHVEGGSSLRIQNSMVGDPGSFGIRVIGTGALILDADNSVSLPTRNVRFGDGTNAGPVIQVGNDNSLGTGTVTFEANSNSSLQSKDTNARTLANPLTFNSTTATLGATSTGNLSFTGAVSLAANLQLTVNNSVTFSNSITQNASGRTLTKAGTGTLVLSAANNYSGGTTFAAGEAGIIAVSHSGALGSGSVQMTAGNATSQLDLSGGITLTQAVRVSSGGLGTGDERTGALKSSGGDNVLEDFGFGNSSPGTRINVATGSLTIKNNIATDVGNNGFRVIGAGTLILDGDNSAGLGAGREFRFGSNLGQGPVVKAGHDKALGLGMIAFSPNSNSTLQSKNASARSFTNNLLFGDTKTTLGATGTGDLTFTGNVTLGGSVDPNETISDLPDIGEVELTIHNTVTLGGTIGQAAAGKSLAKAGSGTLVLGGANTYSGGTTVNAGTLLVNNTSGSGLGTGAVTVDGGTLGGTGGFSGAATINTTGVLSPGASIGTLATGALTLDGGSTFQYELNTTSTTGDLLNINGDLDIDAMATLGLVDLGASVPLAPDTKFTLMSYAGTWNGVAFDGYDNLSTFTLFNNDWLINYDDSPVGAVNGGVYSSAVTLTVVPEPRAALIGGLGVLILLRRRR